MMDDRITANEYRTARDRGCIIPVNSAGCMLVRGHDAKDLLHRMTTNDIMQLSPDRAVPTVFTTEKGRVVDHVLVTERGGNIILLCSPGNQERLIQRIEKFTIMEDVGCSDVSSQYWILFVGGPCARNFLSIIFNAAPLPDEVHRVVKTTDGDIEWTVIRVLQQEDGSFLLISGATADDGSHLPRFLHAGLEAGMTILTQEKAEVLRIEQGCPAFGKELTEEVNPLDAGLQSSISFTKGCYIGQEVIARLTSQKKVQRALVGIQAETGETIEPKSALVVDEADVGWMTSSAVHPVSGKTIGLGYIRIEHVVPGSEITIRSGESNIAGKIIQLPFQR